nr:hypothetical protein [Nitrosomonas nitrosa]
MSEQQKHAAIAANIDALATALCDAFGSAAQAREYMSLGQRNAAIGTIIDVEQRLNDAVALVRAALALHRTH